MIEKKRHIEVCLSSNFKLGFFKVENYPVKHLYDAGVKLSLNTDDPVLFKTHLTSEYLKAMKCYGFDLKMLIQCNLSAVEVLHDESCRPVIKEKLMKSIKALSLI